MIPANFVFALVIFHQRVTDGPLAMVNHSRGFIHYPSIITGKCERSFGYKASAGSEIGGSLLLS